MIAAVQGAPAGAAETTRLREAGAAFEALILKQMLAGLLPGAEGAGGVAIEALARDLSEASPFGVARLLETRS